MLRLTFIALAVVILGLIALALLPERQRAVPDSLIQLERAQVTLYPQADPEAVWHFGARTVTYQPSSRETTLLEIEEGARTVADKTDFTIRSERVTIDRDDNLRGERMFVHLLEPDWHLDMQAKDQRLVLIDQRTARFEVPLLDYTGTGLGPNNRFENVSTSFDLTEFEAGGPGTVGYNEFEDTPRARTAP